MLDEGNPMSRRNDGTRDARARDAPNAARVARARDAPTDGAAHVIDGTAHVVDGAGGRGNGGSEGRPREKKGGTHRHKHGFKQTHTQTHAQKKTTNFTGRPKKNAEYHRGQKTSNRYRRHYRRCTYANTNTDRETRGGGGV